MATDRARNSYDRTRQYRSVVAQQGRVTLEADTNEAEQIRAAESRAELIEIIGPTGTPDHGFQISVPSGGAPFAFTIGAGAMYVGGVRLEQYKPTTYADQDEDEWLDRAEPEAPSTPEIVYLEVTEQEVTAVEDPALLEDALGGPDTTGRTRLIRHVRRGASKDTECESALLDILAQRAPGLTFATLSNQLLPKSQLKVNPIPVPESDNACQPIAKSGFLGAENQLIRVKVSSDGDLLWSYDNGSSLYRAKDPVPASNSLELLGHPVDEFHRPRPRQFVEVLHPAVKLADGAYVATAVGEVYEVSNYDAGTNTITLTSGLSNVAGPLFVRVWDGRFDFNVAYDLVDCENRELGLRVETKGTATPGDYWMIGVRPTHPEKIYPERLTRFQLHDGPARWITPLATITWLDQGKVGVVHDCRRPFKPLTEDDDLAFHNQHLHGWGVVCGMQVHCMELAYAQQRQLDPTEWVTVKNGYAIDPTGVDIRLSSGTQDKLTAVPIAYLALTEAGFKRVDGKIQNGSVSLWIDREKRMHVERYQQKPGKYDWKALWEQLQDAPPGESLLADIYRDCILKVIDYIKALVPESSDPNVTFAQRLSAVVRGIEVPSPVQGLVGESARRLIALLNLVWQAYNPKSSRHIYLSGDAADPTSLWTEDGLLRTFFEQLKKLLQSKTFCAMFDDVQYPAYDVYRAQAPTPHPSTIFGTNRHTRIRVHHTQQLAFTCGNGSQINVYDLKRGKILQTVEFPSTGAEVQDVAFSNTGNEIYAIAWTGTQKSESTFAGGIFDPVTGAIAWSGRRHVAQLKLVTLVNDPKTTEVYIAARGSGVYRFDPCSATDAALPTGGLVQVGPGFSASGHLVGGNVEVNMNAVHVCVDAAMEKIDAHLPRPWAYKGFSVDTLDPVTDMLVLDENGVKVIEFPSPGARFTLPVPASKVTAKVQVYATPIALGAYDSAGNQLGIVKSTALKGQPQTLTLTAPAGNIAYVEVTQGSWEGILFELCIDGEATGGWRLFAGEDEKSTNSVAFTTVREIDVKDPGMPLFHPVGGTGHDDLAFAGTDLQAIVDGPGGTKRLLTWDHARGNPVETDLGQSAGCRIAYTPQDGGWSLITYLDTYLGRAWRKTSGLEQNNFHPLQILPISIAAGPDGEAFYVLEWLSNTITAIPATDAASQIDPPKLEAYRVAALTAFLKLFRRFAQFLKDCVCEHLLVNCPDPTGKKVYLADISFKNGAIYQICNFHHRRYVHTFPTVEYWMSLVPLIPFVKMQVERFCCDLKLGDFFEKHIPPDDSTKARSNSMVPPTAFLYGMTHLKAVNAKAFYGDRQMQLFKVMQYAMQKFTRPAAGSHVKPTTTHGYSGISVNEAVARAKEDDIRIVNVVEATSVLDAALKVAGSAANVRRGEAVDLITDDGVVIGVAKSAAPPRLSKIIGEVPEENATATSMVHHEEIVKLRDEMRSMRKEIEELKKVAPLRPGPHG